MRRPAASPLRLLLAWALLELVAAAQVRTPDGTVLLGWVRAVAGPPLAAVTAGVRSAADLARGLGDVAALAAAHRRLRTELERARVRERLLAEEVRLLRGSLPLAVLGVRLDRGAVVAACRYRRLPGGPLEIAGGVGDGLRRDQPVLAEAGLVGRVWRVGAATSWVEPVTAPTAAVAVTVGPGGRRGLAVGTGGRELEVRYLPRESRLVVGDELRTTGDEGLYPPGLPVARVVRVRESAGPFLEVAAEPVVDLATVRLVVVLAGWRRGGGAR